MTQKLIPPRGIRRLDARRKEIERGSTDREIMHTLIELSHIQCLVHLNQSGVVHRCGKQQLQIGTSEWGGLILLQVNSGVAQLQWESNESSAPKKSTTHAVFGITCSFFCRCKLTKNIAALLQNSVFSMFDQKNNNNNTKNVFLGCWIKYTILVIYTLYGKSLRMPDHYTYILFLLAKQNDQFHLVNVENVFNLPFEFQCFV